MSEDQVTQAALDQPHHMREALAPPVLDSALAADLRQLLRGPAAQRGQALSRIGVETRCRLHRTRPADMVSADRADDRFGGWWRHRGPRVLVVGELVLAAAFLAFGVLSRIVGVVAAAVMVAATVAYARHDRYWWCERCVQEGGPDSRLEQLARRRGYLLHCAHLTSSMWFEVVLGTPLFVGLALLPDPGRWIVAITALVSAVRWYCVDLHQRLGLYCPCCRDDDGGGGDPVLDPSTGPLAGVKGRPLT